MEEKRTFEEWLHSWLYALTGNGFYFPGTCTNDVVKEMLGVVYKNGKPIDTTDNKITVVEFLRKLNIVEGDEDEISN